MKITKETLSRIILEELESLDEKPSRQAKRQKKAQAKAKRRQARKKKAASPSPQGKPEQKAKKSEFAGLSPEEQSDALEKKLFGDKEEGGKTKQDKAAPQAGKKDKPGEQPEEIQKVSNEIQKLQKKLQSWAMKTAAKIPAEDKKARLAVMKIPMALKIANQSIDKISKQDNKSLQAVLDGENPAAKPKEAAANRKEVEEAVIYDLEELLKNEV